MSSPDELAAWVTRFTNEDLLWCVCVVNLAPIRHLRRISNQLETAFLQMIVKETAYYSYCCSFVQKSGNSFHRRRISQAELLYFN